MAYRCLPNAFKFPSGHVTEIFVVTFRFAIHLVFFAEMSSARLFTFQSIAAHEFTQLDKVGDTASFFCLQRSMTWCRPRSTSSI